MKSPPGFPARPLHAALDPLELLELFELLDPLELPETLELLELPIPAAPELELVASPPIPVEVDVEALPPPPLELFSLEPHAEAVVDIQATKIAPDVTAHRADLV